jgi:hypothetical protein
LKIGKQKRFEGIDDLFQLVDVPALGFGIANCGKHDVQWIVVAGNGWLPESHNLDEVTV